MRDQDVHPSRNFLPPLDQFIFPSIVCESSQIRTPGRSVNRQTLDLHEAVFEKFGIREAKLSALKQEVVIPADADHMLRRCLSKPDINVLKCLFVLTLEGAKISTVNQHIALRNRQIPMLTMRIRDDAE